MTEVEVIVRLPEFPRIIVKDMGLNKVYLHGLVTSHVHYWSALTSNTDHKAYIRFIPATAMDKEGENIADGLYDLAINEVPLTSRVSIVDESPVKTEAPRIILGCSFDTLPVLQPGWIDTVEFILTQDRWPVSGLEIAPIKTHLNNTKSPGSISLLPCPSDAHRGRPSTRLILPQVARLVNEKQILGERVNGDPITPGFYAYSCPESLPQGPILQSIGLDCLSYGPGIPRSKSIQLLHLQALAEMLVVDSPEPV